MFEQCEQLQSYSWPLEQRGVVPVYNFPGRKHPKSSHAIPLLQKLRGQGHADAIMVVKERIVRSYTTGAKLVTKVWGAGTLAGFLWEKGRCEDYHMYYQLEDNKETSLYMDFDGGSSEEVGAAFLFTTTIRKVIMLLRPSFPGSLFAVHVTTGRKLSAHLHVIRGKYMSQAKHWGPWLRKYLIPSLSAQEASIVDLRVYGARLFRATGQSKCTIDGRRRVLREHPSSGFSDHQAVTMFDEMRVAYECLIHPHCVDRGVAEMDPVVVEVSSSGEGSNSPRPWAMITSEEYPLFVATCIEWIEGRGMSVTNVRQDVMEPSKFTICLHQDAYSRKCGIKCGTHSRNHIFFVVNCSNSLLLQMCPSGLCAGKICVCPVPDLTLLPEPFTIQNCTIIDSEMVEEIRRHQCKKFTFIAADCGSGKTYRIAEYIRNNRPSVLVSHPFGAGDPLARSSGFTRVLFVTTRISFANSLLSHFAGFQLYSEIKGGITQDNVIVQYESLHRVTGQPYELVVLDEVRSLMNNVVSIRTNRKRMDENQSTFNAVIRAARQVLVTDADLLIDQAVTRFLTFPGGLQFKSDEVRLFVYSRTRLKRSFYIVSEPHWWDDLKECIKNKRKVVVCCGAAWECRGIATVIRRELTEEELGDDFSCVCFTAMGDEQVMADMVKNINQVVENNQMIVYTSKICVGVDITVPVDNVFVMPCIQATTPREMYQMVCRCRNLRDTDVRVLHRGPGLLLTQKKVRTFEECMESVEVRQQILKKYVDYLSCTDASFTPMGRQMMPNHIGATVITCDLENRRGKASWLAEFARVVKQRGQKMVSRLDVGVAAKARKVETTSRKKRMREEDVEIEENMYEELDYRLLFADRENALSDNSRGVSRADKFHIEILITNLRFVYVGGSCQPEKKPPITFDEFKFCRLGWQTHRIALMLLPRSYRTAHDIKQLFKTAYVDFAHVGGLYCDQFSSLIFSGLGAAFGTLKREGLSYVSSELARDVALQHVQEGRLLEMNALLPTPFVSKASNVNVRKMAYIQRLVKHHFGGWFKQRQRKVNQEMIPWMCLTIPALGVDLAIRTLLVHNAVLAGDIGPISKDPLVFHQS